MSQNNLLESEGRGSDDLTIDDLMFIPSALDDLGLSVYAFRILCHLQRRTGKDGIAFPGMRSMAEVCQTSPATVHRAIKELKRRGLITVIPRKDESNVYRLNISHLSPNNRAHQLRTMPYKEYLKTPEWQKRRKAKLKEAKHRCQLCNDGGTLNVHHRTYENRGNEPLSDLIVLCEPCHERFHGIAPDPEVAQ